MRVPELLIVGIVAGGSAAAAVLLLERPIVESPASAPDTRGIVQELHALREDIALLKSAAERSPAPEVSSPTQASSALLDPRLDTMGDQFSAVQAEQAKLSALLSELEVDIKALSAQVSSSSGSEPMPAKLPETPADTAKISLLRGKNMTELSEAFNYWDYDRVLAEYGRPDRVQPPPNGVGMIFVYEMPDENALIIMFKGGKSYRAYGRK
ncbi:MAG TPA: hypothetical protein VFY71_09140 [Planctomycetota bacterium]|nr:hypothetical protein [Planctomycetota bacterium]